MKKPAPDSPQGERQSAPGGLPYRRVKYLNLRLSRRRSLLISLRKFRTAKQNRAKTFKQLVVPIRPLPFSRGYREIAIKQQLQSRRAGPRRRLPQAQTMVTVALIAAGLTGTAYFGVQLFGADTLESTGGFSPPTPSVTENVAAETDGLDFSEPTRLRIPGIGIDTGIMRVGQEDDGTMEVPPLEREVSGWYQYSPSPGEIGPAVIVGHVDTRDGPSVFWRLREMKPGDVVEVAREDGQKVSFKVDGVEEFDQDNFPTEKVYGNIDHAGLRLITCSGSFNRQNHRYTHNTVVFAAKIPEDKN